MKQEGEGAGWGGDLRDMKGTEKGRRNPKEMKTTFGTGPLSENKPMGPMPACCGTENVGIISSTWVCPKVHKGA